MAFALVTFWSHLKNGDESSHATFDQHLAPIKEIEGNLRPTRCEVYSHLCGKNKT